MINKIVISAAGRGTRMGNLTKDIPKPMLEVLGKPFLFYLLENVKKAGFTEIIVVVGYKSKKVEDFLDEYDSNIKTVNQFEILGEEKYGTACPIMCVEDTIGGENFISINGDNLYSSDDLKAFKIKDSFCYVAGFNENNPKLYSSLITDGDFVKEIIEKPEEFSGSLINVNLFKFTKDIFKTVDRVGKSIRGEYEITDAINYLAKEREVKFKIMKDYWKDFGRPEDIASIEEMISEEFNITK